MDCTRVLSFFFKTTFFAFQQPGETYELYRMFVLITLLWHFLITLHLSSGILHFNMRSNSWYSLVFPREVKTFIHGSQNPIIQVGTFIMSLSIAAVAETSLHRKPASTGNFGVHFFPEIQLTLYHRTVLKCSPAFNRSCNFWKCFSIYNGANVFKY